MEIQKQIDELTLEKWRFYISDKRIYLDAYYLLQKESKRHRNFRTLKRYERLSDRNITITESEVPFTDEIKKEALNQFVSMLKVMKWSER